MDSHLRVSCLQVNFGLLNYMCVLSYSFLRWELQNFDLSGALIWSDRFPFENCFHCCFYLLGLPHTGKISNGNFLTVLKAGIF